MRREISLGLAMWKNSLPLVLLISNITVFHAISLASQTQKAISFLKIMSGKGFQCHSNPQACTVPMR